MQLSKVILPKVIGKLKSSEQKSAMTMQPLEKEKNSLTRILQRLRFQVTLKLVTAVARSALIVKIN